MEQVLAGIALALAIASLACSVLLPVRLAHGAVQRACRRVVRDMQELLEESELSHAKLRQHILEVLDATERKRKSVAASASKLDRAANSNALTEADVLRAIEARHANSDASWE